ncbi:hypothetical protein D5086_032290 [Populus alba]|uniref:Uncharacterized protein n=1 Tax=Populus alba TaxID=43335 RepID=A0ACC4AKY8_POPAL
MIKRVRLFMRTIAVRRTLTNPVDLLVCLRAIKNNAFQASEYPVVITFEDHPPANLQAKVAEMVTKTIGGMLYCPKIDQLQEFRYPLSLKKNVMILTKPPNEYLETQSRRLSLKIRKDRELNSGFIDDHHEVKTLAVELLMNSRTQLVRNSAQYDELDCSTTRTCRKRCENPKEGIKQSNEEKLDSSRHVYYVTLSVNYDWVTKFIMSNRQL